MKKYENPKLEISSLDTVNVCTDLSAINFDEADDEDTDANI